MLKQLMATKSHMTQAWTKSGVRIPVTVVKANDCYVAFEGKKEDRIIAGQGIKKLKNVNKPQRSQLEKAGLSFGFKHVQEFVVSTDEKASYAPGSRLTPSMVFQIGDVVKVSGVSKGKGFTGVVKRHGFAGGPRTHGQSDRERAPGSIGSGTTPGRVYRNKRMAGRSGNTNVSVLNLPIIGVNDATGEIWINGIVPGTINSPVTLTKTGEMKFEGLTVEMEMPAIEEVVVPEVQAESAPVEQEAPVAEEVQAEEAKVEEVVAE